MRFWEGNQERALLPDIIAPKERSKGLFESEGFVYISIEIRAASEFVCGSFLLCNALLSIEICN